MINPFKEAVARELASHVPIEFKEILESIEIPPRSEMGDYAFPCFKAAKILNKKPAQVAQELIGKIANLSDFSVLKNLGPYINFVLKSESLASFILNEIYKKGENFGIDNIGNGKCVVIDYSSPNIAKPFGIHHLRSTVIGNSLSKIYRALGYEVVGINHLGDWGKQFGILMASFMRWGNRDSLNKDPIGYLYDLYVRANNAIDQGDSKLNDEAAALFNALENGDAAARDLWQTFRDLSLAEFSGIYKRLDIEFQSYEGEAFYNQRITATMEKLKNSGLAVLSEGAWIVDLKSCGLGVAIIQKADGTTIYLTRDICAAEYRMEKYKFHKLLYVVGQPQELHFKQLFKILDLLGHRWASCCEHVKFGYILGMSSRKGSLVRLEEVLDEARKRALEKMKESPVGKPLDDEESVAEIIGRTAVVFNDLSSERIKDIEFNWDRMLSFEGDTGPYLQNAHARISSILRKADIEFGPNIDYSLLSESYCKKILNLLIIYPEKICEAARLNEPSIISSYLLNLASAFHSSYNELRIIGSAEPLARARLLLYWCVKTVLKNGLTLLGIPALDRM